MENKKIKVMTVFGTRPEAIKMAPIVLELAKHPDKITPVVAVTAQHREMLDQVLGLFNITPDHDLDIMAQGQTLFDITSKAMMGLDKVLEQEKPDIVLVHGDTTTTFAGALAAYYHQTTVGHVEAGLRTHDKYSPFPEEMNRKLTGCIADLNFAPTETSESNLLAENVKPESIFVTGNTVIDALHHTVRDDFQFEDELLQNIDFENIPSATISSLKTNCCRILILKTSVSFSSPPIAGKIWASPCAMSTRPCASSRKNLTMWKWSSPYTRTRKCAKSYAKNWVACPRFT